MNEQNRNLILATLLSFAVIMTWTLLFPPEEIAVDPAAQVATQSVDPTVPLADPATPDATAPTTADQTAAEVARIAIETPELTGSISMLGGRIDDLALTDYRETLDEGAPIVRLLRPVGELDAYFAAFGWTATDGIDPAAVPGPDTIWSVETGETLTPSTPVTLVWDNGAGQIFRTEISVDDQFMFSFAQSIQNVSTDTVSARPYGLVRRHG